MVINCLKENKNIKWILLTVILSVIIYQYLEEDDAELIGELLALAGAIFIILGL